MVSGDALVLSIAAASIVAKVVRDRLMVQVGAAHPGYGFERHMGYSVPEHAQGADAARADRASPPVASHPSPLPYGETRRPKSGHGGKRVT